MLMFSANWAEGMHLSVSMQNRCSRCGGVEMISKETQVGNRDFPFEISWGETLACSSKVQFVDMLSDDGWPRRICEDQGCWWHFCNVNIEVNKDERKGWLEKVKCEVLKSSREAWVTQGRLRSQEATCGLRPQVPHPWQVMVNIMPLVAFPLRNSQNMGFGFWLLK